MVSCYQLQLCVWSLVQAEREEVKAQHSSLQGRISQYCCCYYYYHYYYYYYYYYYCCCYHDKHKHISLSVFEVILSSRVLVELTISDSRLFTR
ncbi:hypothetical protein E2C01_017669 [Portunus trituberculatus]|uniref:Uncharacterized protein n=1 Tax=Portunus trituberculatus TaxID=210409 RepID=A0A5B7DUD5_PORTR|nr:hypothetical protein [Portunus trituberculatus]